jgi:hypothetical protein
MTTPADRTANTLRKLGAEVVEIWASGGMTALDADATIRIQDAAERGTTADGAHTKAWFRPGEEDGEEFYECTLEGTLLVGMLGETKQTEVTAELVFAAELLALWKQGRIGAADDKARARLRAMGFIEQIGRTGKSR